MNLSRRVFDDVSQMIGSRENPTPMVRLRKLPAAGGGAIVWAALREKLHPGAVAVCISPDNAFKYTTHYTPHLSGDGIPEVGGTAWTKPPTKS